MPLTHTIIRMTVVINEILLLLSETLGERG